MTLFIAGINHFDPMARERVANWLCSLSERNGSPPSFIAVEFDEQLFRLLSAQRPQYRACIHRLWPSIPDSDLDHFEQSLGFEGDTHTECYYGTDVVWLDHGRALPPGTIETHVWQRLQALKFFEARNSLMLPGIVSEQVQPYARAEDFSPERSRIFAERILERARTQDWKWAIAITGASHASDRFENSMRRLLEKAGVNCETRLFCRLD